MKTVKQIMPYFVLICFALFLYFVVYDSTPRLNSTSRETGLQSVETITGSLSEDKGKEFSSAIESIEEGMDMFARSVYSKRFIEKSPGNILQKWQEDDIYISSYRDKIWERLNGKSVRQIIALGKDVDRWYGNWQQCFRVASIRSMDNLTGKSYPKKPFDPDYTTKECDPAKPGLDMPEIYRAN